MRLALIHIVQETNDFNPLLTTLADFEAFGLVEGEEIARHFGGIGQIGGHHAATGEFAEADGGQQVLPDHDRRPVAEPETDRVQPEAVAEGQRHHRMRIIEGSRRAGTGTEEANGLDQFVVAVGHRRQLLAPTVPVLGDHTVPAVDLNILGGGNLEQRLQPAVAEDRILDSGSVGLFDGQLPELFAGLGESPGMFADDGADHRAAHHPPVVRGHRAPVFVGPVL